MNNVAVRSLTILAVVAAVHSASAQGLVESAGANSVAAGAGSSGVSMSGLGNFPSMPGQGGSSGPSVTQVPPQTAPAGSAPSSAGGTQPAMSPWSPPPYTGPPLSPAELQQMTKDLALVNAAFAGETWNARTAIARGAQINARDWQYGLTPLMWAAARGNLGAVRFLLSRGANPNLLSREGVRLLLAAGPVESVGASAVGSGSTWRRPYAGASKGSVTALMVAAARGFNLTVRELLRHGADPNKAAGDGTTALMLAAFSGNLPEVQALLQRGASVQPLDETGTNVLHYAVLAGSAPIVHTLLARGARASVAAGSGHITPALLARSLGYANLARPLEVAAKSEPAQPQAPEAPDYPAVSGYGVVILN